MNTISIITDPATGGTFLTWSIHYLAGHDTSYYAAEDCWVPIPNNPVVQSNAHEFKANHPWVDINQFNDVLDLLINKKSDSFHTLYMHELSRGESETKEAYEILSQVSRKTVLLSGIQKYSLYQCSYEKRYKVRSNNRLLASGDDFYNAAIEQYFKESAEAWGASNLINQWDKREFMALNYKPFTVPCVKDKFDFTKDHFKVDPMQLWTSFDSVINSLFDYIGVELNEARVETWIPVYHQWRKIHSNRLAFMWHFEDIIEYTLNGYYMDLSRFKLDISQEAAIQHVLLYQHNLNLKSWQLEKFTDTKQLHNLLEPNVYHKLM